MQFHMIHNGVRPLAIHCDVDLPLSWQQQHDLTRKWTFEVAANIVMYVTGREAFRPRGASHWPAEPTRPPRRTVRLAKVRHGGNFDPEPLAHERLRRLLGLRERIGLDVVGPVAPAGLADSGATLATLTGTGPLRLSGEERRALHEFAAAGGTVLIDAAGGDEAFHRSARAILQEMYGRKLQTLATVSELLSRKGMKIGRVRYRGAAALRLGRAAAPDLRAVVFDGRAAVLYSREDLTAALLGTDSATASGYHPHSAYRLLRNIIALAAE